MRRSLVLVSASVLACSLATASAVAAPAGKNGLVASFQAVSGGEVIGSVSAQLFEPSEGRLVPGFYDFQGAPGWPVREAHAQLGKVLFYYDPAAGNPGGWTGPDLGANVAYAEGVICEYSVPNEPNCHDIYLWFVDVLDPAGRPDYLDTNVHLGTVGEWDGTSWGVGKGAFVLSYAGSSA